MELRIDGQWQYKWYDAKSTGGEFGRQVRAFRNLVTADASADPRGEAGFEAPHGRDTPKA